MNTSVRLCDYENSWYKPGASSFVRALWLFVGMPIFRCSLLPLSSVRVAMLRFFGAHIGERVVIRSGVKVKYPWHLIVGDDTWIGEEVWIDNLTTVRIGSNVCISQGAYFCTGNHDWSDPRFGLKVAPITLHDGCWAAARSILLPGTALGEGAIAAAGSVINGEIPAYEIFAGNPASFVRRRQIGEPSLEPELWKVVAS